jgi:hypothetical protein
VKRSSFYEATVLPRRAGDQADEVLVEVTLHWWTLEGVREWVTRYAETMRAIGTSPWHPRGLWFLVRRFPGWGDLWASRS